MTARLLLSFLTITTLALVALVVPLGVIFADHERDSLLTSVERDATAVAALVEEDLERGTRPRADAVLAGYAAGGGRIVVVDRAGLGVADSQRTGGEMRDFATRPEIVDALAGRRASGVRPSETLGAELMYVAVPVSSGGQVYGAVRITYPISELNRRIARNWLRLAVLSAVVLGAVTVVGFLLARGVTRPVRRLDEAARRLANGQLDTRVSVGHAAPELRTLGETFNTTADRLERLVDSQRQFVADASHELRTPLTALRLRLETLERHLPVDQRARLDAAVAETVRLSRLVDSLLMLARADAAPGPRIEIDLSEVLTGRIEAWTSAAEGRHVRLVSAPAPASRVQMIAGAPEQILDNLLSNAVAASPPGGTVTVTVDEPDPGWVEVRVRDEGPGLDPEDRAHAFDRFWRAPGAPAGGSGLGLAIARRLTEACGGSLVLAAPPSGPGLEAVVRLPAHRHPAPASSSRRSLTSA